MNINAERDYLNDDCERLGTGSPGSPGGYTQPLWLLTPAPATFGWSFFIFCCINSATIYNNLK